MTTLAGLAIAGLALAGCASSDDAPADDAVQEEGAQGGATTVGINCVTEGGAEFPIVDFETSWDFEVPGDAIAECTGELIADGDLTEEQAAAAEALGQPDDAEAIVPLYGVCAHPELEGLLDSDSEDEQTTVTAALALCPHHPLADDAE
ncbi:hypothetical protein [uncultured Agrococcus sp.]|uniref:hypothetical protein n=1 Tax=uncultured Agrococcus sp. TaxID=382258 RepID=UPI0025DA4E57|nr:hypothetical protein [uncultured Agrococcus sp.]